MVETTIKGRIEFCEKKDKQYNRTFTAKITESPASQYGNKTAVLITFGKMKNGRIPENLFIDTRYDRTLKSDGSNFKKWLENEFIGRYRKHKLIIE